MSRHLYSPDDTAPFPLSRTKLDLFRECPRCFYFELRYGLKRPPGLPFSLNAAVDGLLKREFDRCRKAKTIHPYIQEHDIDAIPYDCPELETWRNFRKGIRHHHAKTGFEVYGALDDVWVCPSSGQLIVVDYKATAKAAEVSLDADWQVAYREQVQLYQWLLRRNGKDVSDTAIFVYCNGCLGDEEFASRLRFRVKLIPYTGSDGWVEERLMAARQTLMGLPPAKAVDCDYCAYRDAARGFESAPEIARAAG